MEKDEGKVSEGVLTVPEDTVCPQCGAKEFEMRDYSLMWHEGYIHCAQCGKFIRRFDAG